MTTARIICGDALESLRTLESESVQCVVCSPPYYGLRDYGTAEWDGGHADCGHVERIGGKQGANGNTLGRDASHPNRTSLPATGHALIETQFRDLCGLCGATRIDMQIGLESSPADYIAKLVAVFREVRRVLRKDGVAWVNMGDSYANNHPNPNNDDARWDKSGLAGIGSAKYRDTLKASAGQTVPKASGLANKNLMGMPWRLAFALQADGWYLRQDIIWAKPNPMPESVTDRCTKAHEYVFLLSKSERYFYDADAIAEEAARPEDPGNINHAHSQPGVYPDGVAQKNISKIGPRETRNKRSVWTLTTEPYPEAHFATFPTELPRICILAGSKIGDTILDPFAGSGTTLQVALELSRAAIGIELNAEYVALANRRLNSTTLGLPLEIAA